MEKIMTYDWFLYCYLKAQGYDVIFLGEVEE